MAHVRHAGPHVRDDVDDCAGVTRLGRGLHRLGVALARDEEPAGEVVADHRVPALGRNRLERRCKLPAGIVDEEIDVAEFGNDRRDRLPHAIFFADVAAVANGLRATGFADLASNCFEFLEFASDEGDTGAKRRKLVCNAATDPRAAAGHQSGAPGEKTRAEDRLKRR